MANDTDYGVRITGDASGAKAAMTDVENGLARVSKSLRATADDADLTKQHWEALNDAHGKNATSAEENAKALKDLDDELATLMSRLDPAYRATKQFQDGQGVLTDGLKQNLITQKQYDGALASLTSNFAASGEAAGASALGTAQARRELIVLGHEAMTGNFSRMPGSFMVLANRMGATALLFNPITAGIVAVGAVAAVMIKAFADGAAEANAMNNALALTSDYAGLTRGGMRELAQEMTATGTATVGTSKQIVTQLVASGQIGAQAISAVARLASDYAAATGKDVAKIAPDLEKLFADPAQGAEELNKQMHFLSPAEIDHIAHLERIGDLGAAQLELAQKMADHIPKEVEQLGYLGAAWDKVKKAASDAWDAILGVGRPQTVEEKLADAQAALAAAQAKNARAGTFGFHAQSGAVAQAQTAVDAAGYDAYYSSAAATTAAATAGALAEQNKTAALVNQTSEYHKILVLQDEITRVSNMEVTNEQQGLDKARTLYDLRKQIRDTGIAMGSEEKARHDQALAADVTLYDTRIKGDAAHVDALVKLGQMTTAQGEEAKYYLDLGINGEKQWQAQQELRYGNLKPLEADRIHTVLANLQLEADNRTKQYQDELAMQKAKLVLIQQEADARMSALTTDAQLRDLETLQSEIDAQKLHNSEIGKTKAQIDELKAAELERAISLLEYDRALNESDKAYLARLDAQLAKLRELRGLQQSASVLQAQADATKKYTEEWKKANDEVSRYLSDAIMRGFDKGRSFAKTFMTTLENGFKTLVLTPVIKFILSPVTGAITTAMTGMGLSGSASAAGSGLNLLSGASNFIGSGGGILGSSAAYSAITGGSMAAGSQAAMLAAQTGEFGAAGLAATAGASAGMTALATAIPYVGIALAAAGALGLFGGKERTASPQFSGLYSDSTITSGGFRGGPAGQAYTAMGSSPTDIWGGSTPMALPADQLSAFNVAIKSVFDQMSASAKAVGIDTSALQNLTVHMGATGNGVQADMTAALAATSDQIAKALIPNIESLQQNGETLAQTFARVTGAQVQATAAAQAQTDALAKVRQSWQDQIDVLTGARTQLQVDRANQLASTTDAATQALMNQVFALQDQKTAADAAAQAAQDQAAAEAQLAQARQSWQDQIDVLTGARTQLQVDRANQLASTTDAATQALMNQTFALQDQKTAADAAAQAQKDQAAATQAATQAAAQAVAQEQQQIASAESSLGSAVQGLASKLHIDTLQTAANSLATSDFLSPTDRFAAAQKQLADTYAQATGGDLGAVQNFPAMLQSTLSLARDVYASGPQFQQLFVEGTRELNDLLSRQSSVQNDILKDIPITIQQGAADTVAAIKTSFATMTSELASLRAELRRLTANPA